MTFKIQIRDGATILRRKQVEARTGLSRSTIYKFVALGSFPKPVQLGSARAVGWVKTEIDAWLEARIESSRSNASNKGRP